MKLLDIKKLSTKELMEFDGLAEAEKLTGKSYRDDKKTSFLGMSLSMMVNVEKEMRMVKAGDTNSKTTLSELEDILEIEGFHQIYVKEYSIPDRYSFTNSEGMFDAVEYNQNSSFHVYWNDELNSMLYFSTYPNVEVINDELIHHEPTINNGSLLYTIESKLDDADRSHLSTCCQNEGGSIRGSHDIRNGLRLILNNLKNNYKFLPWQGKQFLWLLHYSEHAQGVVYDSNEINGKVISRFPKRIQKIIEGNYYE